MPKDSAVHRCYAKLKKTKGKASAARICQSATGTALSSGKPPKKRKR